MKTYDHSILSNGLQVNCLQNSVCVGARSVERSSARTRASPRRSAFGRARCRDGPESTHQSGVSRRERPVRAQESLGQSPADCERGFDFDCVGPGCEFRLRTRPARHCPAPGLSIQSFIDAFLHAIDPAGPEALDPGPGCRSWSELIGRENLQRTLLDSTPRRWRILSIRSTEAFCPARRRASSCIGPRFCARRKARGPDRS